MKPDAGRGGLSRRQLLALTVGAPLAAAGAVLLEGATGGGARRQPHGHGRPALPPGRIVGPDAARGHRLRPGSPPPLPPPEGAWRGVDVLIVGGGVAGLAAAWRMEHAGFADFELLEMEEDLGGTSRCGKSEVIGYPWGAHYLVLPGRENRALIRLLEEVGAVTGTDAEGEPEAAEEVLCRDPQERLFMDGRWHAGLAPMAGASSEDLREFAAFREEIGRWAAWRDASGRRAFDIPVAASSRDAEVLALDRVTMKDYLDRLGLRSPRVHWYADLCCRDDYGLRVGDVSAWAGIFYHAARLRRPEGKPQPLLVWPEGNGRLVGHLAQRSAGRVRSGWMTTRVARNGDSLDVWAENARGERAGWRVRRVILAVPPKVAARLVESVRPDRPAWLDVVDHTPWLVANLHLRSRPAGDGHPLAWDNVLFDSPGLGYVTATHQTEASVGPTVVTYYTALCDEPPAAARRRLLESGRDVLAEGVLADLERAHPDIRSLTERLDLMLWGHGMVRPRPGVIGHPQRDAARAPAGGVHFAHTDLSGIALFEEAFDHGLRAAEEVLESLGRRVPERWAAGGS